MLLIDMICLAHKIPDTLDTVVDGPCQVHFLLSGRRPDSDHGMAWQCCKQMPDFTKVLVAPPLPDIHREGSA